MSKKLIIVALAVVMSAGLAQATSTISGYANGTSGTFNITPQHQYGSSAYRMYDDFILGQGDIANLKFEKIGNHDTDPKNFINLVGGNNQVSINGILNSVNAAGNYTAGHVVFITPKGFTVGANGVVNVGQLSVGTPSQSVYDNMIEDYDSGTINYYNQIGSKVSDLAQNANGNSGKAPLSVAGKIFTEKGVRMAGSTVGLSGNIVSGLRNGQYINSTTAAQTLFDALVNTNGTIIDATQFTTARPEMTSIKAESSLNVSGTVTNSGNVYLTNSGANDLSVSGGVASLGRLRLLNNGTGNLKLINTGTDGGAELNGASVVVQNQGGDLSVATRTKVAGNDVEFINQGSGALALTGTVTANGKLRALNKNGSGMTVSGTMTNNSTTGKTDLRNKNGEMNVNGTVTTKSNTNVINEGSKLTIGQDAVITHTNGGRLDVANSGTGGMVVVGKVDNRAGDLRVFNDAGLLQLATNSGNTVQGKLLNSGSNLYVISRKNSTGIKTATNTEISTSNGNLAIKHNGSGTHEGSSSTDQRGLDLMGNVSNTGSGETAINNYKGNMYVSGNIASDKNMGIINRNGGGAMTLASGSQVSGSNINFKNDGSGDMTVNNTITHTGRVNVIANKGALNLGGTVHNNSQGAMSNNDGTISNTTGFNAIARNNATGLNVSKNFVGDGTGEYLFKNRSGANGLRFAGSVTTSGNQIGIVNRKGNMTIKGTNDENASITTTSSAGRVVVSSKTREGDTQGKLTIESGARIDSGAEGIIYVQDTQLEPSVTNPTIINMKGYGLLAGQQWPDD